MRKLERAKGREKEGNGGSGNRRREEGWKVGRGIGGTAEGRREEGEARGGEKTDGKREERREGSRSSSFENDGGMVVQICHRPLRS